MKNKILTVLESVCSPKKTKYSAAVRLASSKDIVIAKNETVFVPLGVKINSEYIFEICLGASYTQESGTNYFDVFYGANSDDLDPIALEEKDDMYSSVKSTVLQKKKSSAKYESLSELTKEKYNEFMSSGYLQLSLNDEIATKGIIAANGVGIINLDYDDEIKLLLHNASGSSFEILKGERIGQLLFLSHISHLFDI